MVNFSNWVPKWLVVVLMAFLIAALLSVSGMYGVIFHNVTLDNGMSIYDSSLMLRVMLIGTSCFFAAVMQLKSCWSPKQAITTSIAVVLICLLAFPHLQSMSARFPVCIISGFFQMWGLFEAIGIIRGPIIKKTNLGMFMSFLFLVVLSSIDVFVYLKTKMSVLFGEDKVLLTTSASLMLAYFLVLATMKSVRVNVPPVALRVWVANIVEMMCLMTFTLAIELFFFYLDKKGWVHLTFERSFVPLLLLAVISLFGMRVIRRRTGIALIDSKSLQHCGLVSIVIIFLVLDFAISTQNLFQRKFITDFLSQSFSVSNMGLVDLAGLLTGFAISLFLFRKGVFHIKTLAYIAFGSMLLYAVFMYLATGMTDSSATFPLTMLSIVFLGMSHILLFCIFNVYLLQRLDFPSFFPVMCVLGIFRSCIGASLGGAVVFISLSMAQSEDALLSVMNQMFGIMIILVLANFLIFLLWNGKSRCAVKQ